MPNYFSSHPTHIGRAQQMWQILVGCAHRRETLTYGLLAEMIGVPVPISLAYPLGQIQNWCLSQGFPVLTILVVRKNTGKPGSGAISEDVDSTREAVYAFNWYDVVPPTADELAEAKGPGEISSGA